MIILVILLVVLIFGFLVFVHELGHFVAARRSGVDVPEFGFGFPPRLVGKKIGKTIYSINAIPLGGFVRMKGETLNDTAKGTFGGTSFWQKTLILFAGVTMNALTAFAMLVFLCLTGLPPVAPGQYSYGNPTYKQPKQVIAVEVAKDSPAQQAGLHRGDLILSANGQPVQSEQQLVDFTKAQAGQTVTLLLEKSGHQRTIRPTLRPPSSKQGFLGVTPFQTYQLKYKLTEAIVTAAGLMVQLMYGTLAAFAGLVSGLFVHGKVSEQVAGPVGIVVLLKSVMDLGLAYVLVFVASISISLAVVNALPLPALDGGRWLMAAVQKITKKQLSVNTESFVHLVGFAALLLLMVVVTFFDIKRLG